jgi:Mor family transcriptional regulator
LNLRAILGEDLYRKLVTTLGGQTVYVPKEDQTHRDAEIRATFLLMKQRGFTRAKALDALEERWPLSRRQLARILAGVHHDDRSLDKSLRTLS